MRTQIWDSASGRRPGTRGLGGRGPLSDSGQPPRTPGDSARYEDSGESTRSEPPSFGRRARESVLERAADVPLRPDAQLRWTMRHITGTSGCTLQGAAMGPWGLVVVCGPRQLHLLCSSRGPRRQAFRCATGQALLGWRARVRWPVVLEGAGSEARLTRREHTDRLFPPACGMLAARRRADWPTAAGFEGQVRGFWKRRQSMRGQAHSASVRRSAQWRRSRTLGPPQAVGSGRCERRAHYPSISEAKLHPLRSAGQ